MKDGCIVEEGEHRLLMSNINGEYANLIKSFHDDGETNDSRSPGNHMNVFLYKFKDTKVISSLYLKYIFVIFFYLYSVNVLK